MAKVVSELPRMILIVLANLLQVAVAQIPIGIMVVVPAEAQVLIAMVAAQAQAAVPMPQFPFVPAAGTLIMLPALAELLHTPVLTLPGITPQPVPVHSELAGVMNGLIGEHALVDLAVIPIAAVHIPADQPALPPAPVRPDLTG